MRVTQKSTGESKPIEFRWLGLQHLPLVEEMTQLVTDKMENSRLFVLETMEEVAKYLENGGFLIGGFVDDRLVVYRYGSVPGDDPSNLARGFVPDAWLSRVLHLEAVAVHPDYRGNNLQVVSFRYGLPEWEQRYPLLFNTVSPFNPHSLANTYEYGSKTIAIRRMYPSEEHPEGVLRTINARGLITKTDPEDAVEVESTDVRKQQILLMMGYAGVAVNDDGVVRYEKVLETLMDRENVQ